MFGRAVAEALVLDRLGLPIGVVGRVERYGAADAVNGQRGFRAVQFQFGSHALSQERGVGKDDRSHSVVLPFPGDCGVVESGALLHLLGVGRLVFLAPADGFPQVDVAEVGLGR